MEEIEMAAELAYDNKPVSAIPLTETLCEGGSVIPALKVGVSPIGHFYESGFEVQDRRSVADSVKSLYFQEMSRLIGYNNENVPNCVRNPMEVLDFALEGRTFRELDQLVEETVESVQVRAEETGTELTREELIGYGLGGVLRARYHGERDKKRKEMERRGWVGFPLDGFK
jgi:hypothetical protein